MKGSKKNPKKKKLSSVPTINRRLFKLWSEAVRNRAGNKCEYCGLKKGDIGPNGNPITKIDAHHFISKKIKDCPLKFEILNGISVDPFCHKFGIPSFHRDPITTITWLIQNHYDRYQYILNHPHLRVDLQNRKVLEKIEEHLRNEEPLDIEKLMEIEKMYPRQMKTPKTKIKGSLFDVESSSSSED